MKLTEKEAEEALRSLQILRQELDDFTKFRDELEIIHLEGLDETRRGAKIVISKSEHRTHSLNMPYRIAQKWVLENIERIEASIKIFESKFKTNENELRNS